MEGVVCIYETSDKFPYPNYPITGASAGFLDGGRAARLIMGPTGAKRFNQRRVAAESISWGFGGGAL